MAFPKYCKKNRDISLTALMEVLRRRHGDVVFIVTSDNVSWARAQLAHNDTFFSANFTRAGAGSGTHSGNRIPPSTDIPDQS